MYGTDFKLDVKMGWRVEGIKLEHERSKRYFSPDVDSIIIHVERVSRIGGSIVEYTDDVSAVLCRWMESGSR